MIEAFLGGDLAGAIAGNAQLLDAIDFQSSEEYPNPLPAKAICRAMGLPRRTVPSARWAHRPPELDVQAAKILAAFGPPSATGQPVA